MRNIAIIATYVFVTRQYLRTPIFDILRANPDNLITVYTPSKRLAKEFRFANVQVRGCKFLFGLKKSDLIIVPEWQADLSMEILKKSVQWNIPTFFIQEGMGNPAAGYTTDIYPTKICAWGDMSREIYIKRGIDPDRVVVTGQPRFDWYYNLNRKRLFSTADKKVLLYTTHPLWLSPKKYPDAEEIMIKYYNTLYEISRERSLQLVCKLHPSDTRIDLYKRGDVIILKDTAVSPKNYIREYCNTGYDPSISDMKWLGQVLASCDVSTTIFSTTSLEAMILGRPVIFFDIANCYKRALTSNMFIDRCRFALATNKEEFLKLLDKYLDDPNADCQKREEVIYDFAYKQDGKASQRVVDLIEQMLIEK